MSTRKDISSWIVQVYNKKIDKASIGIDAADILKPQWHVDFNAPLG
jgi:hypothetical protein